MSIFSKVIDSRPNGFWTLESTGPYPDFSGGGVNATVPGSQPHLIAPMSSGSTRALYVDNTKQIEFTSTVFSQARGLQPFSIEMVYKPISLSASYMALLTHAAQNSGFMLNNDFLRFRFPLTSENIDLTVPVADIYEGDHLVATFDGRTIKIIVNSIVRAEYNLTLEQVADGFAAAATNTYRSGAAVGSEAIALDYLAMYAYALDEEVVAEHFAEVRNVPSVAAVVARKSGIFNEFLDSGANIHAVKEWTGDDFLEGLFVNSYVDGGIVPDVEAGESVAGEWYGTLPLTNFDSLTIDAAKIEFEGEGSYTVSTSINNGSSWQAVNSHSPVSGIGAGFTVAEKAIDVKVVFTGGIVDDTSIVRSIRVVAYQNKVIQGSTSIRPVTVFNNFLPASARNEPIENNDKRGINLASTSYAVMAQDTTDDPKTIRSVEVHIRFTAGTSGVAIDMRRSGLTTAPYFTYNGANLSATNFASGVVYVNGAAVTLASYTFELNTWYKIIFVPNTSYQTTVTLGADYLGANPTGLQAGHLAVYEAALTADEAASIHSSYDGNDKATIVDTDDVNVTETSPPTNFYAYEWSVTGAI